MERGSHLDELEGRSSTSGTERTSAVREIMVEPSSYDGNKQEMVNAATSGGNKKEDVVECRSHKARKTVHSCPRPLKERTDVPNDAQGRTEGRT